MKQFPGGGTMQSRDQVPVEFACNVIQPGDKLVFQLWRVCALRHAAPLDVIVRDTMHSSTNLYSVKHKNGFLLHGYTKESTDESETNFGIPEATVRQERLAV
jgi:hypothetical protein